jgi:superfamily II DNA/RNA helicase
VPQTRLHAEQQFRDGAIQALVATEAAGEGINLQCCHVLLNCDIPWNRNRLVQRMGRIHRYGQREDCLIFNFVATNTIEGRMLQRLLERLREIREAPAMRQLRPDLETEAKAMQTVMAYEQTEGRQVYDVHEKNLGYDLTSLDLSSGALRLIEVKGVGAATGTVLLTPNERRVAEDRRDCYWLYVVTHCHTSPQLQGPIQDPARFEWHEVTDVKHYYPSVNALTQPMEVREGSPPPYRAPTP